MLIVVVQFPFLPLGVNWKVVKGVHCPILLNGTGLMFLSSCLQKLLQKKVNFRHAIPFSISRGKLEGFETCTLSPLLMDTGLISLSSC